MTDIYFKATLPDGTDFHSGTVDYAAALESGRQVRARSKSQASYACCTDGVLHAATVPTGTLVGGSWPCRLFEVTGQPVAFEGHKRGFRSLRVLSEVDAHLALGPQGAEVAALIERLRALTRDEAERIAAMRIARDATWYATRHAAGDATMGAIRSAAGYAAGPAAMGAAMGAIWYAAGSAAARDATWYATRDSASAAAFAATDAARALAVRHLIGQHGFTQAHYDTLTYPLRAAGITVHPDDEETAA